MASHLFFSRLSAAFSLRIQIGVMLGGMVALFSMASPMIAQSTKAASAAKAAVKPGPPIPKKAMQNFTTAQEKIEKEILETRKAFERFKGTLENAAQTFREKAPQAAEYQSRPEVYRKITEALILSMATEP